MSGISELIKKSILYYRDNRVTQTSFNRVCDFLEMIDRFICNDRCRVVIKLPDFDDVLSALCLANVLVNIEGCTIVSKRRSAVEELLSDLSTIASDYYTIFVRSGRVKLYKNFTTNILKKNSGTVLIFGYPSNKSFIEDLHSSHGRAVLILTGVDVLDRGMEISDTISALKKAGWKILNFDFPWIINKKINLRVLRLHTSHFKEFHKLKNAPFQRNYKKYIVKATNFYFRISVPLKIYSKFMNTLHVLTKYLINLPSREIEMLASIKKDFELKKLAERLTEFEKVIWHRNPKYEAVIKIIDSAYRRGNRVPIVFPNRTFSKVFKVAISEDSRLSDRVNETVLILYKRTLAERKQSFRALLLTSIPSPELLLQASLRSEELILPVYLPELKYLEKLIMLMNGSDYFRTKYGLNVTLKINKHIIDYRDSHDKFEEKYVPEIPSFEDYINFSRLLENSEADFECTKRTTTDTSDYIIKTEDGDEVLIRGCRKILRYTPRTIFIENSLEWVAPSELVSGDTVIWFDYSVLKSLLKNELKKLISEDVIEKDEFLQLFISLISMWKKCLYDVSRKHENIAEIHRILQRNGLRRRYVTVKHWFSGLSPDPIESVIEALLNPEINIGPQSKEDIAIFARTFGFDDVCNCAEQIYSAMELFRTLNRRTGRFIRKKIISMILNGELHGKYRIFKVSEIIEVMNND